MGYKEWVARQRGNPVLLIGSIVGFTMSFWLGYRNLVGPWFQQKRMKRAENYANILLQEHSDS